MSLTYADISAYISAGNTAAEIAALLNEDYRHVKDCMATSSNPDEVDLLDLLQLYEVLRIDGSASWKGPLVDAVAALNDAELAAGFEQLLMNLQITNRPVRCGTYSRIGKLTTAVTNIVKSLPAALAVGTATQIQATMDSLTGGRRFGSVTEQDVQDVIDVHTASVASVARLAAIRALWSTHVASTFTGSCELNSISNESEFLAGLRAFADAVEG